MSSDDSFFVSDELADRIKLDDEDEAVAQLERNTTIIVVQCATSVVVGSLRYFRREGVTTAIEISCSLDSALDVLTTIESGIDTIDVVEFHRGVDKIVCDDSLKVDGYYISDVDAAAGQALFGLKLSKKRAEVL